MLRLRLRLRRCVFDVRTLIQRKHVWRLSLKTLLYREHGSHKGEYITTVNWL